MSDKLLTISSACERGFSRSALYRLAREKRITIVHIGRAARIAESDLSRLIEELKEAA
ncbi:MAG: helix-turn-helix domain-containing protein [Sphingomonadales bacterium]|nr:helix-turn-helix domain-containing protein [Sphingomonadales bacterium]MBK6490254.1 helix-turn-helix domain-containing protein [Sphingomonadales bacterium]MBK6721403.1 helix-turn-helix domain-containing protein [Sphingomonadales bacterium]MBK7284934.1 helix-turn-helix domain-containing protein [Sphingomonadales bacterium]MBK8860868.1 helix-turn-helix domain-containing protein [Sphingomonadales bacterium]